MQQLEETGITCPYCAEPLVVLIDCSTDEQSYYEDCQVCCRPISISYNVNAEGSIINLVVQREDD